jgi:hypothetical protein
MMRMWVMMMIMNQNVVADTKLFNTPMCHLRQHWRVLHCPAASHVTCSVDGFLLLINRKLLQMARNYYHRNSRERDRLPKKRAVFILSFSDEKYS